MMLMDDGLLTWKGERESGEKGGRKVESQEQRDGTLREKSYSGALYRRTLIGNPAATQRPKQSRSIRMFQGRHRPMLILR